MKEKIKNDLLLFWTFLKIGAFTFGGGVAMLGIIEEYAVERYKWIDREDFFQIVIIAESTPGPIAVNMATYIGYKVNRFWGSLFATIGLAIPSLLIIYVISLFFEAFMSFDLVNKAFKGITCGVAVILISTVFKLAKQIKKNFYFYFMFAISLSVMILFTIFIPTFSWISIILISIGLFLGVLNTALANKFKNENKITKGDNK